jgi:two-component system invasion response regulator UvrY
MLQQIKILIVEDHTLVREGWSFFLKLNPRLLVVGETGSGEEAIILARQLNPDVIIMDINLPGINGLEATEKILAISPQIKILGVSMNNQSGYAKALIQKGGMGYVTKNSPQEELYHAIIEVASGKKYVCNEIKDLLSEQMISNNSSGSSINSLSGREMEVIAYIKAGKSSKEIAELFGLSIKTVEAHRYNILKKLNLKNTAALINFVNTQQPIFNI